MKAILLVGFLLADLVSAADVSSEATLSYRFYVSDVVSVNDGSAAAVDVYGSNVFLNTSTITTGTGLAASDQQLSVVGNESLFEGFSVGENADQALSAPGLTPTFSEYFYISAMADAPPGSADRRFLSSGIYDVINPNPFPVDLTISIEVELTGQASAILPGNSAFASTNFTMLLETEVDTLMSGPNAFADTSGSCNVSNRANSYCVNLDVIDFVVRLEAYDEFGDRLFFDANGNYSSRVVSTAPNPIAIPFPLWAYAVLFPALIVARHYSYR